MDTARKGMKRLLMFVAALASAIASRGAVYDVRIDQQTLASPPTWTSRIVTPVPDSLIGFGATKLLGPVTVGSGLIISSGVLQTTGATILPTQTGQSGKFLTTNGTIASWSLVPLTTGVSGILPAANGGAGLTSGLLKANGAGLVSAAVAGTDYAVAGAVTGSGLTMATARLLGRTTALTGAIEEISVGTSLSFTAGALNTIQDIRTTASPTFLGTNITALNADNLSAGTLPAGRFPALTGDLSTTAGALATTLSTVNGNVGQFGSATAVGQFTVNAKGLVTAAADVTVTPAVGSVTGLGTGVATFLATPSSANLASAVTGETGSGALVFGTSPTLTGTVLNSSTANNSGFFVGNDADTGLAYQSEGGGYPAIVFNGTLITAYDTNYFNVNKPIIPFGGDVQAGVTIGAASYRFLQGFFGSSGLNIGNGAAPARIYTSTDSAGANLVVAPDGAGTLNVVTTATNPIRLGANATTYGILSFNNSLTSAAAVGLTGGGVGDNSLYYLVPTNGLHHWYVNGATVLTLAGSASTTLTGGAGNMTITAGTGNSRTMALQTTTSGGTATTALTLNADQSATFGGPASSTVAQIRGAGDVSGMSDNNGSLDLYAQSVRIVRMRNNSGFSIRAYTGGAGVMFAPGDPAAGGDDIGIERSSAGVLKVHNGSTGYGSLLTGSITVNVGSPVTDIITAVAALDFGSILAAASADLTITVTGAAVGDNVLPGLPADPHASLSFDCFVSAANTVTIRAHNVGSIAVDQDSKTFRATIVGF